MYYVIRLSKEKVIFRRYHELFILTLFRYGALALANMALSPTSEIVQVILKIHFLYDFNIISEIFDRFLLQKVY